MLERYYADKWFLKLTFRQAAITIATYHCARANYSRGRDFLQLIIEDQRHDEETRFILVALLRPLCKLIGSSLKQSPNRRVPEPDRSRQ